MESIVVQVDADLAGLVPSFLANRRRDIERIRDALASNDHGTIRKIGHAMKGTGGTYGFDRMTRLGAKIERGAKAGDMEAVRQGVDRLVHYLDRIEIVYE